MSDFERSGPERRAESHVERRLHHVDRNPRSFRFAGELFNTAQKDKNRENIREERERMQRKRPVGIGFGEKDNYGPDDSWDTAEELKYKPVPEYYTKQRSEW